MALSGTINGSVTQKSNYFSFYLTWSATQNIPGNYSDVTVTTYWATNNTYKGFDTEAARNASITINGTTTSITKRFNVCASGSTSWASTPYKIQTATTRVFHEDDGTKSITISARANGHAASYGPSSSTATSADCTASASITLDTIPRASSFSLSTTSVNVESSITATISRKSTSFTHTVEFYINNSYYQKYTGVTTSRTFPIPSSWYSAMPSTTQCTAYCRVTTYNGSTQIGSAVSKSFTVNVSSSIVPSVGTITITPQTYSYILQGKNRAVISVSGCSAGAGSSIKSYTFSGPGLTATTTTSTSVTTGIITGSGDLKYTVQVTDSRGRTTSKTSDPITSHAYSAPYFKSFTATRSADGATITCNYSLSVASVIVNNKNQNSSSVKIYARVVGSTSWGDPFITTSGGTYDLRNRDKDSAYEIYAVVEDNYGGSNQSSIVNVSGTAKILNIKSDGNAIAFGRALSNEENNVLASKWPIDSDDPARTMHNLTYRGNNVSDGTSANWAQQYMNLATIGYSQNVLSGQPTQHGFLLNIANGGSDIHQLWMGQPNGALYHRGGNSSTLNGWRTVVDSYNVGTYAMTQPTVLYSSDGTHENITLTESAANFSYIEIFYRIKPSLEAGSLKIYNPNSRSVYLSANLFGSDDLTIYRSAWTIYNTTLMRTSTKCARISNSGVSIFDYDDGIRIYRVLGYK